MAVSGLKLKTLPAVTVATAGTRQALYSTALMVYSVTISSKSSNTGIQYIGDSTVTSANGMNFEPGGSMELSSEGIKGLDQFDVSKIYVDSSTNGAEFRILVWIRE